MNIWAYILTAVVLLLSTGLQLQVASAAAALPMHRGELNPEEDVTYFGEVVVAAPTANHTSRHYQHHSDRHGSHGHESMRHRGADGHTTMVHRHHHSHAARAMRVRIEEKEMQMLQEAEQ